MNDAGKVTGIPRGEYDASVMYERLDIVRYNNAVWMAKKNAKGVTPAEGDYWMLCISQLVDDTLKPDSVNAIQNKVVCAALDEKPSIVSTGESHITDTVEAPMLVTKATVNLLNPTLATTTQNGVTCTKNSDGTYTLNGTATITPTFFIVAKQTLKIGSYKVTRLNDSNSSVSCSLRGKGGDGILAEQDTTVELSENTEAWFYIRVGDTATLTNVVVKPMLTTDLNATYDDFVPYDGYDVKTCGKNLVVAKSNFPTSYPVKCTKNNDGTYTLSGSTSKNVTTSTIVFEFGEHRNVTKHRVPNGTYKLIGLPPNIDDKYKMYFGACYTTKGGGLQWLTKDATPFSIDDSVYAYASGIDVRLEIVSCSIDSELSFDNIVFKPMLTTDLDATYDDFVPYTESSVHIDSSTQFPLLGLKSFDGETNIISPGNVEVAFAKNDSGKAILGMCKPTVKNLVSTIEGNPLDATMGAQLKNELDELKAKVDAMSTSTTTE